jgi:hypothetical protein
VNVNTKYVLAILSLIVWMQAHAYVPAIAGNVTPNRILFIENKGQWNKEVLCRATMPGGQLYITKNALVYTLSIT